MDMRIRITLVFIISPVACVAQFSSPYVFQGTQDSYAGFPYWNICSNSRLSFDFKSYLPNGLLAYEDDTGGNGFIELKLVFGELKLRLKFAEGKILNFKIGENLNDSRWHNVIIQRSEKETKLTLDKFYRIQSLNLKNQNKFGSRLERSQLFIGGVPQLFALKLAELSLPTVIYEPRLSGAIANISYINCTEPPISIEPGLIAHSGLRQKDEDGCSVLNPCSNGGRCLNTEDKVICDCQYTRFEGPRCAREQRQKIATFSGDDFLYYNFTGKGEGIVSSKEVISLTFKTTSSEGLLFYTGESSRFLNVGLHNGVVYLAMDMGDGEEVDKISGIGKRFDDDVWHHIVISRTTTKLVNSLGTCTLYVSIDDMYETSRSFSGHFTQLTSKIMFLGGTYNLRSLPGTQAKQNFHGCLRDVRLSADSFKLYILKLAYDGSSLISQHGEPQYGTCQPVVQIQPISILDSADVVVLQKFAESETNFFSITFSTSEKDGLLIYAAGQGSNVFAVEIFNGYLYFILENSGDLVREKVGDEKVNTGTENRLSVTLQKSSGMISLNGVPKTVKLGESKIPMLKINGPVNLAGLDESRGDVVIHPAVYTAGLRKGFVGCLNDVKIDGRSQNLKLLARQQDVAVAETCSESKSSCSGNPCKNEGLCEEGWRRPICYCDQTAYTGSQCSQESSVMRFDGTQQFTVSPRVKISTLVDDITIQFRTRHSHGALFNTRSKDRRSGLEVFLYIGKLYIQITLEGMEHLLEAGEGVNDYQWHALTINRVEQKVKIVLNNERVIDTELSNSVRDSSVLDQLLTIDEIKVGQPIDTSMSVFTTLSVRDEPASRISFTGHVRQFIFNGKPYIELAHQGLADEITYTSVFSSAPVIPSSPVSIGSRDTYIARELPQMSNFHSIYIQLKTIKATGLILYRSGGNGAYLALEMVEGSMSYIYSVGRRSGTVQSRQVNLLNDNKWHDIVIMRLADGSHYLIVDDVKYASEESQSPKDFYLDSPLYIAGVASQTYTSLPPTIKSPYGFMGCIASLDVNGVQPNLMTEGTGNKEKLAQGCFDSEKCSADSCKNAGVCRQTWPTVTCLCDMTSFTGPACADDGTTYHFGSLNGGLITYTFSYPKPDNTEDKLAFGFITKTQQRSTILRVTSSNSPDMLEISVVDGKVKATYNIGMGSHTVSDPRYRVNDGQYHVVKFTRSGSNSTLQIDNGNRLYKNPKRERLSVFNSMSQIYVGGSLSRTGPISRPFTGLISGLAFNAINILDLAKSNHPSITIQGDARLADLDGSQPNVQADKSRYDNHEDTDNMEIVVPGSRSPCQPVGPNSDYCNDDTGSSEIITRKIVMTEKVPARPTTTKPPLIEWPEFVPTEARPVTSKRLEPSTTLPGSTADINNNSPAPKSAYEISTHGPFDLNKNLPLIAGICGAALVTVILIGVIIYRLTRKEEATYAASAHHRPSCSVDEDLKNDINGHRNTGSIPNMALPVNSPSRRSDGKEWYV